MENEYKEVNGVECTTSCSTGLYNNGSTRSCVYTCESGFYIKIDETSNGMCVPSCEST